MGKKKRERKKDSHDYFLMFDFCIIINHEDIRKTNNIIYLLHLQNSILVPSEINEDKKIHNITISLHTLPWYNSGVAEETIKKPKLLLSFILSQKIGKVGTGVETGGFHVTPTARGGRGAEERRGCLAGGPQGSSS